MNEATKYNRAKTWQIALFALNMMSTNMYLFLMMYVSYYANGILGMSVVFVSTLATSMRIFDGFTDPIIGWLIDHSNGRFGKFRPEFSVLIFQFRSVGIHIVPKCFIRFKSNLVCELELDCSGFSIYFISMAVTNSAAVQFYG